ncbi:DUF1428 domain-containing protein [Brevirhabdus sp.]|uniref:DUF1428 domain-containing protein n=1 Tax=Brevirhabdus sp. TaxID=2004514 RepID=UPI0040581E4B
MSYIMCYVAAVKTARKADYAAHSRRAAQVFRAHGAIRVVECWGDAVPEGAVTSFPLAVRAEPDETVVLGWQEWPDRATHQANIENAMKDPRLREGGKMPFDGKRMIYAGFDTLVDMQGDDDNG